MKRSLFTLTLLCLCLGGLFIAWRLSGATPLAAQPAPPGDSGPSVVDDQSAYLPVLVRNEDDVSCGAIQQAIDNLPAGGGQIMLSRGVFICESPIVIARHHVVLRGQGPATVLSLAAGANSPVLIIGDTTTPPANYGHIHVADLTIDGNRAEQTMECWGGPCDSGGTTVIRNNGVTVRGASDVVIERVAVSRARSGGLVAEKNSRRLTIRDFTATDNQFDGLAAYQTEDSIFTGLYLHDNPFAGLSLDIDFNHNVVTGAVLTNNGRQGIFMRDSRDNVFSDIQIRNSGEQGLFLAQAVDSDPNTCAIGNTFYGLVVADSAQMGLWVKNAACVHNLVVGAQFTGNAEECIREATPGLVEQSAVVCR